MKSVWDTATNVLPELKELIEMILVVEYNK